MLLNISRLTRTLNRIANDAVLTTKRFIGISVKVSEDDENLLVNRNRITDKFPLIWLRDNCTCENCYHRTSQSRIVNWKDFDVNVKVKSVEARDEHHIEVNWTDGHKSIYPLDWLEKRSFTKTNREKFMEDVYAPRKRLWDKDEFLDILKIYEYKDVMNDDEALFKWLKDLTVYGVTLIKNLPENEKECRKITEKVASPKKTHYGEDYRVIAREGTNNVAYSSETLQLHTDLPYYHYIPGVTLLHYLVQTKGKGGENLLTDAFFVAEKIRKENRGVFDILSEVEVNWVDIGEEGGIPFHKILMAPVITLDKRQNVTGIRHSIAQRDSYFTVDIEEVNRWYRALKIFIDEIYSSAAQFKTKPGEFLAFDNTRLLHGRLGYEDTKDTKRLLLGNYLDWDEIYSKLRVLSGKCLQK